MNRSGSELNMIRIWSVSLILLLVFALGACSGSDKRGARGDLDSEGEQEEQLYVYYLNRDETTVGSEPFGGNADSGELLAALGTDPKDMLYKRTLGAEVKLRSYEQKRGQMILDFDADYRKLSKTAEVLFRACVVRTLCQAEGVNSVVFLVEGKSITDSSDVPVGAMRADNFVDSGRNNNEDRNRTELVLYFANEEGTALKAEKQAVVYSTNVAIEKIIVEHLIQGPVEKGYRATLSPDRIVKSVSVKDGICYVDLTEPMLDLTGAVNEEVSVYSIVDSLTELTNINKVQISIEGETERTFRGGVGLETAFERNLDIIEE